MKYLKYFIPIWGLVFADRDIMGDNDTMVAIVAFYYNVVLILGAIWGTFKLIQSI